MKLLLDAGNSRLKWGVHDGQGWLAQGAVTHEQIATLAAQWAAWPIGSVHAASVARPAVAEAITQAAPCPVQWVRLQPVLPMCATTTAIRPSKVPTAGWPCSQRASFALMMWWWPVPAPHLPWKR
jgi:pantothenate kinase type III